MYHETELNDNNTYRYACVDPIQSMSNCVTHYKKGGYFPSTGALNM